MKYYVDPQNIPMQHMPGCDSCTLLGPENGCTGVCLTGISVYHDQSYLPAREHPFQEGFYVIAGEGFAKVGEDEFPLRPGISFLAPAYTSHTVKSASPDVPVRIFWFHA